MRRACAVAVMLTIAGCAGPKNTDCTWRLDHTGRLDLTAAADRRHLADDAQTAEDLAIRHADANRAPDWQRDRSAYRRLRDECRARLNAVVAEQHSVPENAVDQAVSDRRLWLDALVVATFAGLFISIASFVASAMRRTAFADSRTLAAAMLLAASLGAGTICVLGGRVFLGLVESVRIGNGHVSYRAERVPLYDRRLEMFAAGALCFIAVGAAHFRNHST